MTEWNDINEREREWDEYRRPRKKKKKSAGKAIAAILIILVILALGAGAFWCFGGTRSANLDEAVTVVVPEGTYADGIAQILYDNDLILNTISFKIYVKMEDAGIHLKPGVYVFGPGKVTYRQILDSLLMGSEGVDNAEITLLEGYSVKEIAETFEAEGLCSAEDFLAAAAAFDTSAYPYIPEGDTYQKLEGFLFPDTYRIKYQWTPNQMIERLLSEFDKKWTPERQALADSLGLSTFQVVTVASLIEKEALLDAERPTIASVIYNRIAQGMRLQIDASVLYALGKHKEVVTYNDLEVDSPYNTYRHEGLPPGPIASPGECSIDAALNPAATDYLYYQTTVEQDGSHYFCKTYEEHMAYGEKKQSAAAA